MLDQIDKTLLSNLQADSRFSAQELGELCGLSASQVSRRRQRLEADGLIRGYTAKLDPQRVGLAIQAFVQVQMAKHGTEPAGDFARLVELRPEITSVWTLTGEADYLLRVYCADLEELNHLVQNVLLAHPHVARVQSQIVMSQLKQDAQLPL
ncbi:Lrp/AsnC family transcriptional regulator [Actibacterium pelagium]|uniref:Transcriptional regulator n=1 Tax=Actibacterium pelagium TaxID=2029103 RepID=A0A917AF30_9RHOB|nr:Lrp/AsnC family transcriptional regulator [Actibacterium pelagium]GGE46211.1 transcriptional regulator [Actibacterium pelagium]